MDMDIATQTVTSYTTRIGAIITFGGRMKAFTTIGGWSMAIVIFEITAGSGTATNGDTGSGATTRRIRRR